MIEPTLDLKPRPSRHNAEKCSTIPIRGQTNRNIEGLTLVGFRMYYKTARLYYIRLKPHQIPET